MNRLKEYFPFGKKQFTVRALSAEMVANKLARANIPVFSLQKTAKNTVKFSVRAKHAKKVFAIFRGLCYNAGGGKENSSFSPPYKIQSTRPRGALRVWQRLVSGIGFLAGMLFFLFSVFFFSARVLKVEVKGSGSYYEGEVRRILKEHGVKTLSPLPKNRGALKADILSLPLVTFCSVGSRGGVLVITVEVSGEDAALSKEPLIAPRGGILEELFVLCGAAQVSVGQSVKEGDILVSPASEGAVVIASAVIRERFIRAYEGSKENAFYALSLEFESIEEVSAFQTERGWRLEGVALFRFAVNSE